MTRRNEARGKGTKERNALERDEKKEENASSGKGRTRDEREEEGGMTDKRAGIVIAQIKQSANVRFLFLFNDR